MRNHPEKIEKALQNITDLNIKIEQQREQIGLVEAEVTIEINAARDEASKPLYSNDTTRRAAYSLKLAENPKYAELNELLQLFDQQRQYKHAELERLRLEFKLLLLDREEEINRK